MLRGLKNQVTVAWSRQRVLPIALGVALGLTLFMYIYGALNVLA